MVTKENTGAEDTTKENGIGLGNKGTAIRIKERWLRFLDGRNSEVSGGIMCG